DPGEDTGDGPDPLGILWSIFYVAENMDDAYLEGLLDALPGLWERAPGWAETAILRILNTRDEPEDCTAQFEALAKQQPSSTRELLREILEGPLDNDDESLATDQRDSIRSTLAAV